MSSGVTQTSVRRSRTVFTAWVRYLRNEFSTSMPTEPGLTQAQRDEDFAVRIARSMRALGSGSSGAKTLTSLRESLRRRLASR